MIGNNILKRSQGQETRRHYIVEPHYVSEKVTKCTVEQNIRRLTSEFGAKVTQLSLTSVEAGTFVMTGSKLKTGKSIQLTIVLDNRS